ncbi:MAG TPA: sialate O-acetylesterase [Chitinispirillaceae bacterium]|nr:sialate O-acetylesterase [Chitinispirillaceae bacterium]
MKPLNFLTTIIVSGLTLNAVNAEPSKNFKVFLCFGQSNMAGNASATADDKKTTPRVMALAFNDCSNPSWKKDTWVPAQEPLHCGDGSSGSTSMGPAYAFGRVMADSLPNDTIGIIACGQSGVNIEYFMKGGSWNSGYRVPYPGGQNVWDWMLKKCQLAQQRGVIAGIILHQGESNSGQQDWPNKVNTILKDLKKECNLDTNTPFVAGELLYGKQCSGHNQVIAKIPSVVPNSYVASAEGLAGAGDQYHFNRESYLKLGARFAEQMMKGIHVVEKTHTAQQKHYRAVSVSSIKQSDNIQVFNLSGKTIFNGSAAKWKTIHTSMKTGNVFIIANRDNISTSANLMINPSGR